MSLAAAATCWTQVLVLQPVMMSVAAYAQQRCVAPQEPGFVSGRSQRAHQQTVSCVFYKNNSSMLIAQPLPDCRAAMTSRCAHSCRMLVQGWLERGTIYGGVSIGCLAYYHHLTPADPLTNYLSSSRLLLTPTPCTPCWLTALWWPHWLAC